MPNLSIDVKDSEARADLEDLESYVSSMTPISLNVTENGTYTAPTGVFGYSPVTVSVPTGAEIITRDAWDALTTAQKQAKGLVAIQDASTGFKRGEFVNGADYVETYIPYSNISSIMCEATADNFDATSNSWGTGTSPAVYNDNTKKPTLDTTENAVSVDATQGIVPYVSLGQSAKPFTAYVVLKAVSPSTYTTLLSCIDELTSGHGISLIGNNIYIASWASDTSTGVYSNAYFVGCIRYGGNDYITKGYVYDGTGASPVSVEKAPSSVGNTVTLGKMSPTLSNNYDGNLLVKYFAVVDGAESNSIINANIDNLYNEFIAE